MFRLGLILVGPLIAVWTISAAGNEIIVVDPGHGGPAPDPFYSGDADCSLAVNISDFAYLISFILGRGHGPVCTCEDYL